MHTVSSASNTCFRSRSALECTATVLMPSSLQARRIRNAISPRLAITILSSMFASLLDDDQRLVKFYRLSTFDQNCFHGTGFVRFDLVHHFHGFNDAQGIAHVDFLTHFDERFCVRAWGAVESTNHRGTYDVTTDFRCCWRFHGRNGRRSGCVRLSWLLHHWCSVSLLHHRETCGRSCTADAY